MKIVKVLCECGFKTAIYSRDLEEIAAGVWGTINCHACSRRLNKKIQELEEEEKKKLALPVLK